MNIYLAACYSHGMRYCNGKGTAYAKLTDSEKQAVDNCSHLLESYHYCKSDKLTSLIREDQTPIFLDSGAFSAHTLGVNISVADYCDYIVRNRDLIRVEDGDLMASVLDGIGDPLQTWRNQEEMELRGVRPLPCFHSYEDEQYLEHYIRNYNYITLGGLVILHKSDAIKWLDRIWNNYLVDGSGRPKLKVHGFGVTSVELMERYPWYSCDSSSWVQFAAFGHIVLDEKGTIFISEKSQTKHIEGKHYFNINDYHKAVLENTIKERGFDAQRLSEYDYSRYAYNMLAYKKINDKINAQGDKTFKSPVQELF